MPILVEICQGTACFVMGASSLLAVGELLPERWRERVVVRASPCLNLCDRHGQAPFVRIDGEVMGEAHPAGVLLRLAEMLGDRTFTLPEELDQPS